MDRHGNPLDYDRMWGRAPSPETILEVLQLSDTKFQTLVDWRMYRLANHKNYPEVDLSSRIREYKKRVRHIMEEHKFDGLTPMLFPRLYGYIHEDLRQKRRTGGRSSPIGPTLYVWKTSSNVP